eukprot:TRINITY_DN23708_c0_g1_i1.p1 TRINITY_DN23708_c0_g1~~TRINITY_DN23708_c0_g1_i1.p1  ORF type:complete len:209 (-),score=25.39 TRINITY_DN23708_c0_g1_i1:212-838(-)
MALNCADLLLYAALAQTCMIEGLLGASVVEVPAPDFDPWGYDAVFDVRNLDEYAGLSETACSIASVDARGCTYGHVPHSRWAPQLLRCGHAEASAAKNCTTSDQWQADISILGNAFSPFDPASLMAACRRLRVAFICHSGVRSLKAADRYANLMTKLFPADTTLQVTSVLGGTKSWVVHGRPTDFGYPAEDVPARCVELLKSTDSLFA